MASTTDQLSWVGEGWEFGYRGYNHVNTTPPLKLEELEVSKKIENLKRKYHNCQT